MVAGQTAKGAQEAFSLMAGRSDDETTLGPNFFGLAQNKHERAVSTAETFPQNIPRTRPTQAIPWNKACSQDLVIAGLL